MNFVVISTYTSYEVHAYHCDLSILNKYPCLCNCDRVRFGESDSPVVLSLAAAKPVYHFLPCLRMANASCFNLSNPVRPVLSTVTANSGTSSINVTLKNLVFITANAESLFPNVVKNDGMSSGNTRLVLLPNLLQGGHGGQITPRSSGSMSNAQLSHLSRSGSVSCNVHTEQSIISCNEA